MFVPGVLGNVGDPPTPLWSRRPLLRVGTCFECRPFVCSARGSCTLEMPRRPSPNRAVVAWSTYSATHLSLIVQHYHPGWGRIGGKQVWVCPNSCQYFVCRFLFIFQCALALIFDTVQTYVAYWFSIEYGEIAYLKPPQSNMDR